MHHKLVVICGPTATGKTKLALQLAQKFNGEIISADSRQVYKGMDVGTGKDLSRNSKFKSQNAKLKFKNKNFSIGYYLIQQVPIWLYDVVNPNQNFNVADYYKLAWIVIKDISERGRLPILVGGTGLYIKAIVDGIGTLGIPENKNLRKKLENKDIVYLQNKLKEINLQRFNKMNNSDRNNSRRLIRAIEIQNSKVKMQNYKAKLKINTLMIGLTTDKEILYKRIDERVEKRVKQGIIDEIKELLSKGYGWGLHSMSGLGYRQWRDYFEGKESKEKAIEKWKNAEHQYAKHQLTWFKKDKRIIWYDISDYGK